MAQDNQTSNLRLSVSQAAKLFGVSDRTIRRALALNQIRYIIVRNRYQLNFESLLSWSQQSKGLSKKRDQQGIGQWVDKWKISNQKFSPRPPAEPPPLSVPRH
ncbi:MAG: excisionase family DNA-binding protein [Patescibacteria group bacterium]